MNKVGMIGLGMMGHGIATNIMKHDIPMVLYDLRPEAFADLVEKGAEGASSLQELGEKVEVVLMIINSYAHCVDAMSKLLETMHSGTIINMSTIAMEDAQKLEKMAAEKGVTMMDCPVSGGSRGADAGRLTVMASGADELFNKYLPVLEAFSDNVVHVGTKCGQGQAVKCINQLLVGIHMCATAEAFTLARKCDLDLQLVYDTICKSAGVSNIFQNRGQFVIARNFDTRSSLAIQLKDTNIACQTADAVGAPALLGNTARELFKLAIKKYPPNDDSLEVIRLYEEMGNLTDLD